MVLIAIEYDILVYDIDSIFFIKLYAKILNKESGFNVVNVYGMHWDCIRHFIIRFVLYKAVIS